MTRIVTCGAEGLLSVQIYVNLTHVHPGKIVKWLTILRCVGATVNTEMGDVH